MVGLVGHGNHAHACTYLVFTEVGFHHTELYFHITISNHTAHRLTRLCQLMSLHREIRHHAVEGSRKHTTTEFVLGGGKCGMSRSELALGQSVSRLHIRIVLYVSRYG